MSLRYLYLLRGSWPRVLELAYWPTVQMVMWGFITQFFFTHSSYIAQGFGVLLSGVLLWDVLFRSQLGVSVSFLEEMWSRNLAHVFASPLRPPEFVASLTLLSLIRTVIGIVPATLLAILFFGFSVYDLGLTLAGLFANLALMGWAIGLMTSALILRWGLGAESLAWVSIFALAPLSGIYYPIATLPGWLQPVAWALPSAHVFEGMRAVLLHGQVRLDLMASAFALNILYFCAGATIFALALHAARNRARLLQVGE
ncbi:MAG TPA: ABC transporter permease [Alphaproteobacteria bacterium]|nr:ABC transporter permease [Alphaproteobacteria bacterium]